MNFCAVCTARAVVFHHVIYAQHVRARDGDLGTWDNFLPLCWTCHERHHNASKRIPLSCLRDENYTFAKGLLSLSAYDYFRRRYFDDGDPRLDELLEEGMAA